MSKQAAQSVEEGDVQAGTTVAIDVAHVDEVICAVLCGKRVAFPQGCSSEFPDAFLQRSAHYGVQALLYERLHKIEGCPDPIFNQLHDASLALTVWELRHQQVLARLLGVLREAGVEPIFLKGTALAYSLYTQPMMRERGDSDIMIVDHLRARAEDVLTKLGFEKASAMSGDLVTYQASYTLRGADGSTHAIDLHWKINNSEFLSKLFSYDELRRDAVPLPDLAPGAIGASTIHSLLIACMHRETHRQNPYYVDGVAHYDADRLNWLYDIHLLATAIKTDEWRELVLLAKHKGLCAITREGLDRAAARLGTRYPAWVRADLSEEDELAARYLRASALRQAWMDFMAMGGAASRLRFLRQHIAPSATYMRRKYPAANPALLPWLYVRRFTEGLHKRIGVGRRQSP